MNKIDKIQFSENQKYLIDGIIPVQISLIDSMYNVTDHGIYRVVYNNLVVGILIVSNTATSYEPSHVVQTYIGPYTLIRTAVTNPNNKPNSYIYNNTFENPQYLTNTACIQDRYYDSNTKTWSEWRQLDEDSNSNIQIFFNQDILKNINGRYSINLDNTDKDISIYKTDNSTAIINLSDSFKNTINNLQSQIESLDYQISILESLIMQIIGTNAKITMTVTPSVYEKSDEVTMFQINIIFSGITEDDIENFTLRNITTSDTISSADLYKDGLQYSATVELPQNQAYTFEASLKIKNVNTTIKKSVTTRMNITEYKQMWLGAADNVDEVTSYSANVYDITDGHAGTYAITFPTRTYLWLVIPADITIDLENDIQMSHFIIPIDATGTVVKNNNTVYRVYRSKETIKAGTYNIELK